MRFLIPSPPKFSKVTSDFKCLSMVGEKLHAAQPSTQKSFMESRLHRVGFSEGLKRDKFSITTKI